MNNLLHKLAWSASTAGPLETLKGLGRLTSDHVVTKEGIELAYTTRAQRPTLLVMAGQYVDPEYAFFATHGPYKRVVDVGAGIGQFCLYMDRVGAEEIIAFEPNSANRLVLRRNIEANDAKIEVRSTAVGSHLQAQVHMSDRGLNSSLDEVCSGELAVVTSLDAQFREEEIDILKINTAGSEADVLDGALRLLTKKRIRYLCVLDGDAVRDRIRTIDALGYQWFTMGHDGRIWTISADGPVTKPPFCRHLLAVARR